MTPEEIRLKGAEGADLQGADLQGADLRYANLRKANLRKADLQGADLRGADLQGADLRDANLRYAYLRYANLRDADLRYAYLRYANLRDADLHDANLQGADLQYVKGFVLLPIQDPRGYSFVYAVDTREGWKIKAGCRCLSIREAKKHWGKDYVGEREIGDMYLDAIKWLKKRIKNETQG